MPSTARADDRQVLRRYAALTVAIFLPLILATITFREVYPVPVFRMFWPIGQLSGVPHRYWIVRGVTVSGQVVDVTRITTTFYARRFSMVNAVVRNDALKLAAPHPANARVAREAGGAGQLRDGVRVPDLLWAWGMRYNGRLGRESRERLQSIRLEEYRWPRRAYGDYREFVTAWEIDL